MTPELSLESPEMVCSIKTCRLFLPPLGRRVALVKFPDVAGSPPGMRGDCGTANAMTLLDELSGRKRK